MSIINVLIYYSVCG